MQQPTHLRLLERHPGLDRGAAGKGRGEPLEVQTEAENRPNLLVTTIISRSGRVVRIVPPCVEECRGQRATPMQTGLPADGDVHRIAIERVRRTVERKMCGVRTLEVTAHPPYNRFPVKLTVNGEARTAPEGATPKDGPSAGVAMFMALASLMTGRTIRSDTAMTGEISLTGLVLPVGGIKEKVLAAHRAGIRRIILPKANERDLKEVPQEVRDQLTFIPVERIEEVYRRSQAGYIRSPTD